MKAREAVAKRIINLCDLKAITPNALSYRSGVSQSTIKSILNGESKNPGIVTIHKLCSGLGITVANFFGVEDFSTLEDELE